MERRLPVECYATAYYLSLVKSSGKANGLQLCAVKPGLTAGSVTGIGIGSKGSPGAGAPLFRQKSRYECDLPLLHSLALIYVAPLAPINYTTGH